jgi:hypothetical protein
MPELYEFMLKSRLQAENRKMDHPKIRTKFRNMDPV